MNQAQIHLVFNHVPLFACAAGAALLAAGFALGKEDLKKAGLWTLVLGGVCALPAYFSGEGAEELVEHMPGVAESFIHEHEESAELALAAVLAAGGVALLALAAGRWFQAQWRRACAAALVLSLPALGLMARTAHLGGLVRHTELRSGAPVADAPEAENEREHERD